MLGKECCGLPFRKVRSVRGFLVFIPEERLNADSKLRGLDVHQTVYKY